MRPTDKMGIKMFFRQNMIYIRMYYYESPQYYTTVAFSSSSSLKSNFISGSKMFPLFSVRMHILLPISSYRSFASPDEIFMSGGPICKEKKVFNL